MLWIKTRHFVYKFDETGKWRIEFATHEEATAFLKKQRKKEKKQMTEETLEEMWERRTKNRECYACGHSERIVELRKCTLKDGLNGFVCERCAGNDWRKLEEEESE